MTPDQQEAADNVAEAMRVFNATVRRAAAAGLVVDVAIEPLMSTRHVGQVTHLISPRVIEVEPANRHRFG